jgi:hypothetical protein
MNQSTYSLTGPAIAIVIGIILALDWSSNLSIAQRVINTDYEIIGKDCDASGKCSGLQYDSTDFYIDRGHDGVVWLEANTYEVQRMDNCIIFNAGNWRCEDSAFVMRDGLLQETEMDRIGHVYRVPEWRWIISRLQSALGVPPEKVMAFL